MHIDKRKQLFEFNDLSFVPEALRETIVETLGRTLDLGQMLYNLVPHLARFYTEGDIKHVLDLGSGTGTPSTILVRELEALAIQPPRTTLTDIYPQPKLWETHQQHFPEHIDFLTTPVDATAIDASLSHGKARQLINIFHHLSEDMAMAVLRDAIEQHSPIFIAEAFDRKPLQFLNFAPVGLPMLLANPLLSPTHKVQKALLTWCSPVALLASVWDGLVSTMRIYEPADLMRMIRSIEGNGYFTWKHGYYDYPPAGRGFYLYGVPRLRSYQTK